MFGSSSTTSSLASVRCRPSVSVSMLCILARHAEDNLNARWIWPSVLQLLARLAPVGDGGGPGPDAELGVDPSDVVLHGLLGQEQARREMPVGLAVRDEPHYLCLSGRQGA